MTTDPTTDPTPGPDPIRADAADAAEVVIALDDLLKFEGIVGSGGEAKHLIRGGDVLVNGVVETRRRRKLRAGDVVEIGEDRFEVAPGSGD